MEEALNDINTRDRDNECSKKKPFTGLYLDSAPGDPKHEKKPFTGLGLDSAPPGDAAAKYGDVMDDGSSGGGSMSKGNDCRDSASVDSDNGDSGCSSWICSNPTNTAGSDGESAAISAARQRLEIDDSGNRNI